MAIPLGSIGIENYPPGKEGSTLQVILINQQIKGPMRPWGMIDFSSILNCLLMLVANFHFLEIKFHIWVNGI